MLTDKNAFTVIFSNKDLVERNKNGFPADHACQHFATLEQAKNFVERISKTAFDITLLLPDNYPI